MPAAPARPWLCIALVVVAAIVTVNVLSDLNVFFDPPEVPPRFRLAQWLLYAKIAIVPLPALAALVFAGLGRLRHAIVALAAILLLTFTLDDVPLVLLHGAELNAGGLSGLYALMKFVAFPLLAIGAIVFVVRNERLALACVLVSLPTILGVLAVATFGIDVLIYGF